MKVEIVSRHSLYFHMALDVAQLPVEMDSPRGELSASSSQEWTLETINVQNSD